MHIDIHLMLQHDGYLGVFFILLLEMVGIPFPAETTLTISGFEMANGTFQLAPLLLAAVLGNMVGSTIAYWIGRLLGWPVIIGKFIAGIRVLTPYLAGINKMNFGVFSIYNAISALVWTTAFIVLGRYIGIEWTKYHQVLHQYLVPGIIVVAIAIGAVVAWKMRHRKNMTR